MKKELSLFQTHLFYFSITYSSVLNCSWGRISREEGWVFRKNILKWGGGVIIKWHSGNIQTIPWNEGRGLIIKWGEGLWFLYFCFYQKWLINLYFFWNWCVFYKKKRSKVKRIPNGTFGSNVLFWSKDL